MPSLYLQIAGPLLFGCCWLVIAFRLPCLPIGRTAGTLLCAVLVVAGNVLTADAAFQAISLQTLTLLFASMLMSTYLEREGFFVRVQRVLCSGIDPDNPRAAHWLLARVCLLAGGLSALITNDTTCVVFTPLLVSLIQRHSLPAAPFLLALATSSNIGSACSPVGNPQNILVISASRISFATFLGKTILATLVCLVLNILFLTTVYNQALTGKKIIWTLARFERVPAPRSIPSATPSLCILSSHDASEEEKSSSLAYATQAEARGGAMTESEIERMEEGQLLERNVESRSKLRATNGSGELHHVNGDSHSAKNSPAKPTVRHIEVAAIEMQQQPSRHRHPNGMNGSASAMVDHSVVLFHTSPEGSPIAAEGEPTAQTNPDVQPSPLLLAMHDAAAPPVARRQSSSSSHPRELLSPLERSHLEAQARQSFAVVIGVHDQAHALLEDAERSQSPSPMVRSPPVGGRERVSPRSDSMRSGATHRKGAVAAKGNGAWKEDAIEGEYPQPSASSIIAGSSKPSAPLATSSPRRTQAFHPSLDLSFECAREEYVRRLQLEVFYGIVAKEEEERRRKGREKAPRSPNSASSSSSSSSNSEKDTDAASALLIPTEAPLTYVASERYAPPPATTGSDATPSSAGRLRMLPPEYALLRTPIRQLTPPSPTDSVFKLAYLHFLSISKLHLFCFVLLLTISSFFIGWPLAWCALGGLMAMILLDGVDPDGTGQWQKGVDWPLLIFFSGLFIVVEGLHASEWPQRAWDALLPSMDLTTSGGVALFTVIILVGSNTVSNVPLVLILTPSLLALPRATQQNAWVLVAFVSTLAGNLTLVGSVANLIVAARARRYYDLTFVEYLKYGAPTTMVLITLGVVIIQGM